MLDAPGVTWLPLVITSWSVMRPQGADGELRGVATLEADWYKEGRQRLYGYRGRRGGRGGSRPNKQKAYYVPEGTRRDQAR